MPHRDDSQVDLTGSGADESSVGDRDQHDGSADREGSADEESSHPSRFGTLGREWRQQVQESVPREESSESSAGEPDDGEASGALEREAEGAPAGGAGEQSSAAEPAAEVDRAEEPVEVPTHRQNGASPASIRERLPEEIPESDDDDGLGERAELRRALGLLDELIELDPQNPELHQRKARYARRLDETEALAGALREWAKVLESRGEWRSAHFLFHRSLELEPDHRATREALGRVLFREDRLGSSARGTAELFDAPESADEADAIDWTDPSEVLRAELGRATEEVYRLQGAALRLLEARQGSRDQVDARQEACELLGRYYVDRQAYGRAARVLLPILTRTGIWDEDRKDTLYLSGFAFLRLEDRERARECLERLAKVDEAFENVLESAAAGVEDSGEA